MRDAGSDCIPARLDIPWLARKARPDAGDIRRAAGNTRAVRDSIDRFNARIRESADDIRAYRSSASVARPPQQFFR
jgi:hypothetical protein